MASIREMAGPLLRSFSLSELGKSPGTVVKMLAESGSAEG